jgi:hypothetical protein
MRRIVGAAFQGWARAARRLSASAGSRLATVDERASPLGRALVGRLRAVEWSRAMPQLRSCGLWLSVGVTFALCATGAPSGDEPFPAIEIPGTAAADGAGDGVWVDDD